MKFKLFSLLLVATISLSSFAQTTDKTVYIKHDNISAIQKEASIKFNRQALISVPVNQEEHINGGGTYCETICACYSVTYYWFGGVPIVNSYTPATGCSNSCGGTTVGPCNWITHMESTKDLLEDWIAANDPDHDLHLKQRESAKANSTVK